MEVAKTNLDNFVMDYIADQSSHKCYHLDFMGREWLSLESLCIVGGSTGNISE